MIDRDVRALAQQVEPVIVHAGDILLSYFRKTTNHQYKKSNDSIVTDADVASERYLIEELKAIMPEASVWAEESGQTGSGDYCWVIDPLDGTTNFAHGLSYFCISVALTYRNKPILGLIYHPVEKELFVACAGQGATLNGTKIVVSLTAKVAEGLFAICLPYYTGQEQLFERSAELLGRMTYASDSIRKLGAAALDQAYVACGRIDGSMFYGLSWWDVAAGMLLVQEAGGYVADFFDREIGPDYQSFVATNSQLYPELKAIIAQKGTG